VEQKGEGEGFEHESGGQISNADISRTLNLLFFSGEQWLFIGNS